MKKMKFIKVTLELPNEVLLSLAIMAHEQNLTLNSFVNKLLKSAMKKREYVSPTS